LVTQHEELVKKLQAKIELVEGTIVDMAFFQAQALEVHEKLESAQQDIFTKVEAIQNCYRVVDLSHNKIYIKEREAHASRAKFQEAIFIVPKYDVSAAPRLSLSKKTKGDIILKPWESNLAERKRLSREVHEACLEPISSLEKGLLDVEGNNISKSLGNIGLARNQCNSRTRKEEAMTIIQQMNQLDLIQINKWIVSTSMQL
jgi:hypothetical protein